MHEQIIDDVRTAQMAAQTAEERRGTDSRVIDLAADLAHHGYALRGLPGGELGLRKADPRDLAIAEVRERLQRLRTTPTVRSEAERWCSEAIAQGYGIEEAARQSIRAAIELDKGAG